ncbi:MAG: hypothetical protein GC161_11255 [Planctomycetaceae bacterium]|nr:hypothetical protein [Planctomycetaceae bacterium]
MNTSPEKTPAQRPEQRPEPSLARTPALERLLGRLRGNLVRAALQSGLGLALVALAAAAAFAFLADYALAVPRGVRLWHGLLIVAAPLVAGWRYGWRHLAAIPSRARLALLAERADPHAEQLLVSAVDFQSRGDGLDAGLERALVDRVLERAEARAKTIDLTPILDRRGPLSRLGLGAASVLLVATSFALHPAHGATFWNRLLGGDQPWPNATVLYLEIPLPEATARVEPLGERGLSVEVARGTDVPVVVRARGKAPREVELDFGAGRRVSVARLGAGEGRQATYRTVLRGVQEDSEFAVRGGDDSSGAARVRLRVLQPPEIVGLALLVTPPAHTGLAPEQVFDRGTRVVAGSRIAVALRTEPKDVAGRARILPADTTVDLAPRPFPGADELEGLGFEFTANESVRLRFELSDSRGLGNPDPGLFAIDVVPDRAPELEQIAPTRVELETGARGAVALRVEARDDFGLVRFGWRAREAAAEEWTHGADFPLAGDTPRQAFGGLRLDVASLAAGQAPAAAPAGDAAAATATTGETAGALVGSQFLLEAFALDNATPAREGKGPGVRVRVLADDELLRRVQERLGRARAQAAALMQLQRDRRTRGEELLVELEDAVGLEPGDARAVTSALNGQRRVEADAESLLRELVGVVELAVYARLDPSAEHLLDELDGLLAKSASRSFQLEPWRAFLERPPGTAGASTGFATHLISLAAIGLDVRQGGAAAATQALEAAQGATELGARRQHLARALAEQNRVLLRLEDLLERLSEWDDFQSVLTQTREMLERQRALRERTREAANR